MRLSVLTCLCAFLLCCTGSAGRACLALRLRPGTAAAWAVLAALLSGLSLPVSPSVSIQLLSLLLIVCCAAHAAGARRERLTTLLTAFLAGTLGWILTTLLPAFYEPGLLVALPAALIARLFLDSPRCGLLCVSLAPLFYGGMTALSDWYLFDTAVLELGSAIQLDAGIAGMFLFALLLSVPARQDIMQPAKEK